MEFATGAPPTRGLLPEARPSPMADPFALRLSVFYGAFFFYAGLSMPFMPAWLAVRGLDTREIGIVLATPLVARVVVAPVSTRLADRFSVLHPALVAAAVASVAGFALVGLGTGFAPILATYALAATVAAPVLPLADAVALRGLKMQMRSYGSVRLWGSVTFIVANLGGGALLARLGAGEVIWAVVAALALTAAAAPALARLRCGGAGREPDPGQPRGAAGLRHAAMERPRHRRNRDRPAVGARRRHRGRAVRCVRPDRAPGRRQRDDPARRPRRRGAVDLDGVRSAGRSAAFAAGPARADVRRDPPRHHAFPRPGRAVRPWCDRAGRFRRRAGDRVRGRHGRRRCAGRGLRHLRLSGDGSRVSGWRAACRHGSRVGAAVAGRVSATGTPRRRAGFEREQTPLTGRADRAC